MTAEKYLQCPLAVAICSNIPAAVVIHYHRQRWCSLGLNGWQILMKIQMGKEEADKDTADYLSSISDFEFDLRELFVADIIAEPIHIGGDQTGNFEIAALLLEN